MNRRSFLISASAASVVGAVGVPAVVMQAPAAAEELAYDFWHHAEGTPQWVLTRGWSPKIPGAMTYEFGPPVDRVWIWDGKTYTNVWREPCPA